jgi:hypothetical protein
VIDRVARRARYVAMLAVRTRAPLAPLTATILAAIAVYVHPRSGVGETWGLTALMAYTLSAWLVGVVLAAEPPAQAEMATVALGGRRGRAGLDATLVALVAAGQAAWLVGYPLVARLLGDSDVFVPPPRPADVSVVVLAHVCCALAGGSLAVLFAPPRLVRRASAAAAVMISLLAMVARYQSRSALWVVLWRWPRRWSDAPLHSHRTRAARLRKLPRAGNGAGRPQAHTGPRSAAEGSRHRG